MDNNLNYKHFIDIVKRVLELEYVVSFDYDLNIGSDQDSLIFDLSNLQEGYFVEVQPLQKELRLELLVDKVYKQNMISSLNSNVSPITHIIVTQNFLSNNQRKSLKENLEGISTDNELAIFDFQDILDLAKAYSIDLNDLEKEPTSILKTIEDLGSNVYLVGANWGGKDLADEFINEGRWENGYDDKYLRKIRSIREDDLLILKSTFAVKGISKLRVKAIGVVTSNPGNGKNLELEWISIDHFDIDDLGHYRGTVMEPSEKDAEHILLRATENVPELTNQLLSLLDKEISNKRELEVYIDENRTFLVGLEVGEEIKDYDVIFLPKSSQGGVGQNGIAAHILELLGRDRNEIRFSKSELEETKFKWIGISTETKSIEVCFVVSKDIDKNPMDFRENLKSAIYNFQGALLELNQPKPEETKIFIPLLGTGQAKLSVLKSFDIINNVISIFPEYFKNPLIRVNFPREIEKDILTNLSSNILELHQLKEVDNLTAEIDRLYRESVENSSITNTKDKIPFHLDNVETVDKLNREPVAKSLARLINNEIFDQEDMDHSFMVHLQGEWGAGKSTFLNLIEQHLDTDKRKWIVINYNAWQNQHISPPWWSFIDQIYRQSLTHPCFFKKQFIVIREKYRRVLKYSSAYKALTFSIALVLLLTLLNYKDIIFNSLTTFFASNSEEAAKELMTIETLSNLLLSVGVIIGVVVSVAKFFSIPMLMQSSKEAISFMQRSADPMNKIKEHFNSLIGNINFVKYDVAVFIDDIDRCNRKYTVELLEGIQTLFKEKKVLYIVAGDKNWIISCFENNYEEFAKHVTEQGESLGELFLEKAFQLSIRMPEISEKSKEQYWRKIIGLPDLDKNKKTGDDLSDTERDTIKKQFIKQYSESDNSSGVVNELKSEYNISQETASDLAIEALDENKEDVTHLLSSFHKLVNPNPRSIKRLANNYSMIRNTLILEDADFKPSHLFRWLLLEDRYPKLVNSFLKQGAIDKVQEFVDSQIFIDRDIQNLNDILYGVVVTEGDSLKIEDLIKILRK